MYNTIMVPVDGGPGNIKSATEAISLAEQTNGDSELYILSVYDNSGDFEQFEGDSFRVDGLQPVLKDANRSPQRDTKQGAAPDMIAEHASEISADLIVMATEGRTGVSRYLSGSVTEKTVRLADCPVLALHNEKPSNSDTTSE